MRNPIKSELKAKILQESREFVFLTVYLTLFLNSLVIYRGLITGEDIFSFFHIGYNFLEALLLAKVILVGKMLHLGEKYSDRSLFIPATYRAMVFSAFVFAFGILEHFLVGSMEGKNMELLWDQFISQGVNQEIGKLLIAFLVFILLFSFLEISRVVGEEKLFNLFFRRKN